MTSVVANRNQKSVPMGSFLRDVEMSAICADRLVDSSMATSLAVPSGAAFRDPPNRLRISHRQAKHHAVEYRMVVSGTRSGVFSDAMHVSDNHLRVCKRQATTIVDFILLTSLFTAHRSAPAFPTLAGRLVPLRIIGVPLFHSLGSPQYAVGCSFGAICQHKGSPRGRLAGRERL